MKGLIITLRVLGFSFQYTIPFVVFGAIIPYYHGDLQEGLTGFGQFAIVVFCLICIKKIKEKVLTLDDSIPKSLIIAIVEAVPFALIYFCLEWLHVFSALLFEYWGNIIPLFAIGTLLKLLAGILKAKELKEDDTKST